MVALETIHGGLISVFLRLRDLPWTSPVAYDSCMTKATYVSADSASFGMIIRRLRMAEGWTIAEFARRSGFNKNYLSVLEQGKNTPSLNMLFELAEIFRVDAAEMVREVELARRGRKAARAAAMLAAAGLTPPGAETSIDDSSTPRPDAPAKTSPAG